MKFNTSVILKGIPSLALALAFGAQAASAAKAPVKAPAKPTKVSATSPLNQSAAPAPAAPAAFVPGPTADLFTIYIGPSMTAMGSPYQVDQYGYDNDSSAKSTDRVGFENYLSAGYAISPDLKALAVAQFFYTPMLDQQLTWRDPFLRLKIANIVNTNGFSLKTDLRLYVPATQTSQDNGMIAGLRTSPELYYTPAGSRWTLGIWSYIRGNIHGLYGDGKQLDFYLAPNVSYQLTPTVSLGAAFEAYGRHDVEGAPPFVSANDPADLQIGPAWDATPWLNINPYVQVYPGYFSWSSTSVGAYIGAKFF